MDRMFKIPPEKREKSLERIRRNRKIYLAIFYEEEQIKVKVIYELEPDVMVVETERQLDASRNAIAHVGFSETWARRNGHVVFQDKDKIK